MPIREDQLNGRIATLIDRMSGRWRALGENKGAFRDNAKQPDILIVFEDEGGRPIVLENEYLPAHTVESEAIDRLGEELDPDVVDASGRVSAAIALRSPDFLRDLPGADAADQALAEGATLEYALFTGTDRARPARFPKTGFIRGNLRDLAAFIAQAATPEDAIERAADILERGVQDSAAILRIAAESAPAFQAAIEKHLRQPYGEQTIRMAATIIINALVFHQNIAGRSEIRALNQLVDDSDPDALDPDALLAEWRRILGINYWSIFSVASDLLLSVTPHRAAVNALRVMRATANRLIRTGVSRHSDLAGAVFQRLISDRKFLATFYTRPESAALLAHLAMPDDDDRFADPDKVKDYRIADYACGTGALIHAAYRRLNRLHWLAGGDPAALHAHMMENALTACDVLPSAVHLTASTLAAVHPTERYADSRTIVTEYGRTERGGVSIGSLDLLASTGRMRALIPMHAATQIAGGGETDIWLDMPPLSQDLVIMNPPFTRAGSDWEGADRESDSIKPFRALSTDLDTQKEMSALEKKYAKGTCFHGQAGGSAFAALAHRMVKPGGTIALILPITSLQGASWRKFRKMIADKYRDVIVMTIAADSPDGQSFSADTGMAEAMMIFRESASAPSGRGIFVSLAKRPNNEMESLEIARAISAAMRESNIRRLENGPFGGDSVLVGGEIIGEMIDASLSASDPWAAGGISDFAVLQTARHLARGTLWLPGVASQDDAHPVPMATVEKICQVGITDINIVGDGAQTAFTLIKPPSSAPTYPMLWNHNAKRETRIIVAPDSEGRVKRGRESRAGEIWRTRSRALHNRDFRFNSQPLTAAYTERETIGGRAWKNLKFDDPRREIAHTLWANTTLGILCYWHHSTRQQSGRGIIPITALRTMPTLDVRALSDAQLDAAESIFADLRAADFLPANEAYRDQTRQTLDARVLTEMLALPPEILEPLSLLRLKWCSEPSVHGGKGTAPNG